MSKDRRCPHCGTVGACKHGITLGLERYRCAEGCSRTFNAVSDSPLSGLHHKEKWLAFVAAPGDQRRSRAPSQRGNSHPVRSQFRTSCSAHFRTTWWTIRNSLLPGIKAKQLKPFLAQLVSTDSVVVSDACARELGLQHKSIVVSRDGYVRGTWHLQNVNNRHERLKNLVSHRCREFFYEPA